MTKKDISEKKKGRYYQGLGRRKTSISSARITKNNDKENKIIINLKPLEEFFTTFELQKIVNEPLQILKNKFFNISVKTKGGGIRGQAEATRLAIARGLVEFDKELKKELKDLGYLTRDSRKVERKKPGLKKARRAPQFSKR